MAGADRPYDHLPFFYSDFFDLGYEAIGEIDVRMQTTAEWAEPYRRGVVMYVDEQQRPRGFLLMNIWNKAEHATELIEGETPIDADQLRELLD